MWCDDVNGLLYGDDGDGQVLAGLKVIIGLMVTLKSRWP